jgi:hypothetical protein
MGAILAENMLHHEYWRKTNKPTVTTTNSNQKEGFEFVNMLDNNAHTSYMLTDSTQGVTIFDIGQNRRFNGFAVYGHNLTSSQSIIVEYSTDGTNYTIFTDSAVYLANGRISPQNNRGEAFCCYPKGTTVVGRYIKITTHNWTATTFISCLALGNFVSDVNITAPYIMPSFTPHEVSIKRNNLGNILSSDTRKIPQKLNIKLATLTEDDLDNVETNVTNNGSNLFNEDYSFVDYLGHYIARFPFFVLHDDGDSQPTNAEKKEARNKIYFCTIDKSLRQPSFRTPTTLTWSINAVGYIS